MVTITVEGDDKKTVYETPAVLATTDSDPGTFVGHWSRPGITLEFAATSTTITRKAQLGETFIDDNEIVYMRADSRKDIYKILGRIDTIAQALVWTSNTGNLINGLPASAKRFPDAH